ncbi:MAG: hypothetical protein O9353_14105 [Bacteroidia bacterium]|nr:hypothetical protein [Bacteroidia bacterium]
MRAGIAPGLQLEVRNYCRWGSELAAVKNKTVESSECVRKTTPS